MVQVGANGAGKSTLLKIISGVQPHTKGRVYFNGEDISQAPSHRRMGIAQMPEGRQVFSPMSVDDNLRLGAYTRKRQEIGATLQRCYDMFPKLAERRRQSASTLSGGEQQMLAIGRTLMAAPRLLLLDEPSMGPGTADDPADITNHRQLEAGAGHRVSGVAGCARGAVRGEPWLCHGIRRDCPQWQQ